MAYNPVQDWLDEFANAPGPEAQLLLSSDERGANPSGDSRKTKRPPKRDGDAHHGRGYVRDRDDDKDSAERLMEAVLVALFGWLYVVPGLKLIGRCIVYLILIGLIGWLVP